MIGEAKGGWELKKRLKEVEVGVPGSLQHLPYHIAVYRGTNVDQPRNLAKSVTVE